MLDQRRVMELCHVPPEMLAASGQMPSWVQTNYLNSVLGSELMQWIRQEGIMPIEVTITRGAPEPGTVFTVYRNFYCKGLADISWTDKDSTEVMAAVWTRMKEFDPEYVLNFSFHPRHLTSVTSVTRLSGQAGNLLAIGYIRSTHRGTIEAVPLAIGDMIDGETTDVHWHNYREVFVESLDNFALVRDVERARSMKQLEPLREIPERAIKEAFCEIILEPNVTKDWGDEQNDIYTSNISMHGKRISTAIALKGPALFRPLEAGDMGRRGDQIERLFDSPADLLIVQHCHIVSQSVRKRMRAYASILGNPRLYCIIDGFDTLRILRAYKKLLWRAA